MKSLHRWTPVVESIWMSQRVNKPVFLKMECNQRTGSFKIRGIGRLCQEWIEKGKTHLVSSSGGNAGYSVAYAGRKLGIKVTVFVPRTTNEIFIKFIKSQGAEIKIVGKTWDEADRAAQEYVKEVDGGFVPPFDHPTIWAGHSTLVDELVEQTKKPGAIVVSVGGGGLAIGILQGLHRHGWGDVPLFGVEVKGAPKLYQSIQENKLVRLTHIDTIATTLATDRISEELFKWTKKHSITPLLASDKDTVIACRQFVDDQHVLVEPACGAALSVVYNNVPELQEVESIMVIVCGGVGISIDLLNEYLNRFSV